LALKFGKSPAAIWAERFWAAVGAALSLALQLALFGLGVAYGDRRAMLVLAPLIVLASWQLVSRATSGRTFTFSVDVRAREVQDVLNVVFTSAFAINSALLVYWLVEWGRP
jgi:hypothetical protein